MGMGLCPLLPGARVVVCDIQFHRDWAVPRAAICALSALKHCLCKAATTANLCISPVAGRQPVPAPLPTSRILQCPNPCLQALTRKFCLAPDVNLPAVAAACPITLSGADLYALCADAWMGALQRHIRAVEVPEPDAARAEQAEVQAGSQAAAAAAAAAGKPGVDGSEPHDGLVAAAGAAVPAAGAGVDSAAEDDIQGMGTLGASIRKKRAARAAAAAKAAAAAAAAGAGSSSADSPPQLAAAAATDPVQAAGAISTEAVAPGANPAAHGAPGHVPAMLAPGAALTATDTTQAPCVASAEAAGPVATASCGEASASTGRADAPGAGTDAVVVCQADFMAALEALTSSLSRSELAKYEALRRQYEGAGTGGTGKSSVVGSGGILPNTGG